MNSAILTHSHSVYKAKKAAKRNQIQEIVFDDTARHEFLTGFHKRNILKKEAAKERAKEREKQEHLQLRRDQRQNLRQRAIENAKMVEGAYRNETDADSNDNEYEFHGFSAEEKGKEKQSEREFEGKEVLTTVTVIEEFDPNELLNPPPPPRSTKQEELSTPDSHPDQKSASAPNAGRKVSKWSKHATKPKPVKKKKLSYTTKAERKLEKLKQATRRSEKAGLRDRKGRR